MAVCFPGPNIKFTDSGAQWKEEEEEIGGIKRTEDGQTDAKTSSLLIGVVDDNDNAESVKEQSQKRYMVSGSLCPLISFLDMSFSVSFVGFLGFTPFFLVFV